MTIGTEGPYCTKLDSYNTVHLLEFTIIHHTSIDCCFLHSTEFFIQKYHKMKLLQIQYRHFQTISLTAVKLLKDIATHRPMTHLGFRCLKPTVKLQEFCELKLFMI